MIDLNTRIDPQSGWTLEVAKGINDAGEIVGNGSHNGDYHAFLLTPIPEPSTFTLLGISVIAIFSFRFWHGRRNGHGIK